MKRDALFDVRRSDLERLRLAAEVILSEAGECEELIPGPLESELVIFKPRVEQAIMLPATA